MRSDTVMIEIKGIPPVAMLAAKPPVANTIDNEFPSNLHFLRAVCCKDQLRSCNIEKTDFPKLCQNKGLGELVLKI